MTYRPPERICLAHEPLKRVFYLAHPLALRHEIREKELAFEKRTGVELINPFYDADREDIVAIDAGTMERFSEKLDFQAIVKNDLDAIDRAQGIVAIVRKGAISMGTPMEMWYTLTSLKPVFVICYDELKAHPWVLYVTENSGGFIASSFEDFERKLTEER